MTMDNSTNSKSLRPGQFIETMPFPQHLYYMYYCIHCSIFPAHKDILLAQMHSSLSIATHTLSHVPQLSIVSSVPSEVMIERHTMGSDLGQVSCLQKPQPCAVLCVFILLNCQKMQPPASRRQCLSPPGHPHTQQKHSSSGMSSLPACPATPPRLCHLHRTDKVGLLRHTLLLPWLPATH